MRKLTVTTDGIILPSMGDNLSWSIYAESFASFVLGMVVLFKPSAISVQSDTVLQMIIPTISIVLVFALQSINIWRNTSTKKAVISRAFNTRDNNITVMSKNEYYAKQGSVTVGAIAKNKLSKSSDK